MLSYPQIHSDFRLNGFAYSEEELGEVAYSLIKEGEAYEKSIGDFLIDWLDGQSTIEVYTSGSTGTPKRIFLKKKHMENSARATGQFFKLQAKSSALLCLPTTYIAGKMMLVRAMVLGLHLDYVTPVSTPLNNKSKSYDFCAMVPMQLENSLNDIEKIKTLLVGGAPISEKVQSQVQALARKTQIFETYGMTETITHIAIKRIYPSNYDSPYFQTLPKVKISVDKRDCLVINAPEIASEKIVTNDVVKLISDSEFEWLGRYDNIINSGGVKLFPEQIEEKLAKVILSRFFVAGLPDEKLGEKLIVVIEGRIDAMIVQSKIQSLDNIDKFELPKEIYGIPKFVESPNGKIKREDTLRIVMS